MKNLFTVLMMVCAVWTANAKPRDLQQMKQAARQVLMAADDAQGRRNAQRTVMQLGENGGVAVMGYRDGGFAVVSKDDMFPLVLGYSSSIYDPNTANENFKWWLDAIGNVTSRRISTPVHSIAPDPDRFPERVAPLLKTKWGQDTPYNDLCPTGMPTGCVATAASQVLRYNEWPSQGKGTVYTFYPFGNLEGKKYEADIEGVSYDYNLMLNRYGTMGSTSAQKNAVAKLNYHVGLAMKAQYAAGGTGAYNESLCHGLRTNLGYPYAITFNRDDFTEQEWMDKIFETLSAKIPIIYGGSDATFTGHEFVLHGYDSTGKIYINWGWDGDMDGYFDISSLVIFYGLYDFSMYQDMVLRCTPSRITTETVVVDVSQPGTLADLLTDEQRDTVVSLSVKGNINSSDLKTLRSMAGATSTGHGVFGNLSVLDLSGASIVAGGEPYLVEDGVEWVTTSDNEMPYKAFCGCSALIDVTLPNNLVTYQDGVFAQCNNLEHVSLTAGPQSEFRVLDDMVFSRDYTELIECFPVSGSEVYYVIPQGTQKIHDYAFAGRYLYERLMIPETVREIGKFAFNRCFDLTRTYVCAEQPPVIDESAIDDLDLSLRKLYVPKGTRSKYAQAEGWEKYKNAIVEFDAATAIQQVRGAGNPHAEGIYDIEGRALEGFSNESAHPKAIYIVSGKKVVR